MRLYNKPHESYYEREYDRSIRRKNLLYILFLFLWFIYSFIILPIRLKRKEIRSEKDQEEFKKKMDEFIDMLKLFCYTIISLNRREIKDV